MSAKQDFLVPHAWTMGEAYRFAPKLGARVPSPLLDLIIQDPGEFSWDDVDTEALNTELIGLVSGLGSVLALLQLAGYEITQISLSSGNVDPPGHLLVDPVDLTYTWVDESNRASLSLDFTLCEFDLDPTTVSVGMHYVARELSAGGTVDPVPLPAALVSTFSPLADGCLYFSGNTAAFDPSAKEIPNVVTAVDAAIEEFEQGLIDALETRWNAFSVAYGKNAEYGKNNKTSVVSVTGQFGLLGMLAPEWSILWASEDELTSLRTIGHSIYNNLLKTDEFRSFLTTVGSGSESSAHSLRSIYNDIFGKVFSKEEWTLSSATEALADRFQVIQGPASDPTDLYYATTSVHYLRFLFWLHNQQVLYVIPSGRPEIKDREWTQPFLTGTYEQVPVGDHATTPAPFGTTELVEFGSDHLIDTDTLHINQAGRTIEGYWQYRAGHKPLTIDTWYVASEDVVQEDRWYVSLTLATGQTRDMDDYSAPQYKGYAYLATVDFGGVTIPVAGADDYVETIKARLVTVIDLTDSGGTTQYRFIKTSATPYFTESLTKRNSSSWFETLRNVQIAPLHTREKLELLRVLTSLGSSAASYGGDPDNARTANDTFASDVRWLVGTNVSKPDLTPQFEMSRLLAQHFFHGMPEDVNGQTSPGNWPAVAKMIKAKPGQTKDIQGFLGVDVVEIPAPSPAHTCFHSYDWAYQAAGLEVTVDPTQLSAAIAGFFAGLAGGIPGAVAGFTVGGTTFSWAPDGSAGAYLAEYEINKKWPDDPTWWSGPAKYVGAFATGSIDLALGLPFGAKFLQVSDPTMVYTWGRWKPDHFPCLYVSGSVSFLNMTLPLNIESMMYWTRYDPETATELQWLWNTALVWLPAQKKSMGLTLFICPMRPGLALGVGLPIPWLEPSLNTGRDWLSLAASATLVGVTGNIGLMFSNDLPEAAPPEINLLVDLVAPVSIEEVGQSLSSVLFDHNSSELTPDGKATLRKLAIENLHLLMGQAGGGTTLRIRGHASRSGGYEYNWKLSSLRAKSVYRFLLELLGPNLRAPHIEAKGLGERDAIADGRPDGGVADDPAAADYRRADLELNGSHVMTAVWS